MQCLLVAAGVIGYREAPTLNLQGRICMTQLWSRRMRTRKVPTAATAEEVIQKLFWVQMSTPRHTGRRVLVDEAAGQICLQAGNTNRRQQLLGSEDSLGRQQGALHSRHNGDWKKYNGGYHFLSGTPWPCLETGVGPADHYLPPAHRALWSECSSEEDWHFRHFPVWVRTSWPNPRPRPSVLPKVCRETSANMATGCWSDDQAVGLGRRPLPDGWFCGINWTEDLTCTAVDRWRRRRR